MSYKKSTIPVNTTNSSPTSIASLENKNLVGAFAKWMPILFAGAAVGVSIIALKEIKNVRKDLIALKKEQLSNTETDKKNPDNADIIKKMELMDEQIRKISNYLASLENNKKSAPKQENTTFIKKVINEVKETPTPEVTNNTNSTDNNITDTTTNNSTINDEEEYEYEEVTDDET